MAGFFAKLIRRVTHPEAVRRFDAAGGGRRWAAGPSFGPINAEVLAARQQVQSRALYHARNNGWLANAVESWVSNLIGDGILPGSRHPAAAVRAMLQSRFARWAYRCCLDGVTGFYALQAVAVRAMVEAGECFLIMSTDAEGELRLQLIPAERCDSSLTRELAGGGKIIAGIEFRPDGRISAYHFTPDIDVLGTWGPSIRVDAADVVHLFKPLGPGQVRGISWLHAILLPTQELDQTEDGISVGQRVASMFAGFMTDLNSTGGGGAFEGTQQGSILESGLEPGTLKVLPPGVDIKFATPNQAAESVAFLKYSLRKIAAGVGLPTHLVDADLSDANYSSLRAGLLEFRRRCSALQQHIIIPALQRIWERWATLEALSGRIAAPGFEADPSAWLGATWQPPAYSQVDPQKEVEADVLAVNNGFASRASIIRSRGLDPEVVDAEQAADRNRARAAGLAFPFPAPASTNTNNREAAADA